MLVKRVFVRIALACLVLAFFGCSGGGDLTVVIDEDCRPKDLAGDPIEVLEVWKGAEVEWVNETTATIVVTVDEDKIFGTSTITVPAEESKVTTVQEDLSDGDSGSFKPNCWTGPQTGPRVVVKDPPP